MIRLILTAFCIGARGELTRCSDDGEPSGTAGRPMLEVLTDYNDIGKIQYLLGNEGIAPISIDYTDRVTLRLYVPHDRVETLQAKMVDATGGRMEFKRGKALYFVDKEHP